MDCGCLVRKGLIDVAKTAQGEFYILTDIVDINCAIAKIQDAGYEVLTCELEDPFSGFGMIVKDRDFKGICNVLGIKNEHYSLIETDKENTYAVEFELAINLDDPHAVLKRDYARMVMGRLGNDITSIENGIKAKEQQIEQLTQQIYTASKVLADEKAKIGHLQQYAIDLANSLIVEFDKLTKLPEVESVDIIKGVLSVKTKPIEVNVGSEKIRLGAYRIDISPQASAPKFYPTSDNQVRKIRGRDYIHPMIPADNRISITRLMPTFAQLMGEWNFSSVIMLALNVLTKLNSEAQPIVLWR